MKEAIQKAIEGGWETKHNFNDWGGEIMSDFANEALLDPLFWQALGKAMGWKEEMWWVNNYIEAWKYHWHRFIDHLAEGKSPDDFFKELLTNK